MKETGKNMMKQEQKVQPRVLIFPSHTSIVMRNVHMFQFSIQNTLQFTYISDLSRYTILETFNDILKEGRR